ncbi:hypothetical protein [Shinella sp.]|uniref:hypothetical protein n=1 Tax=Shinella sp. TaxID=1870904 RepID=UPI0029B86DE5|nr:hypothetical protein [Shinella sp.]MDX3973263.1 hypothetical protein [Shinella sp.]
MSDKRCPHCGKVFNEDVAIRLAQRLGQIRGNGFPWQRIDAALLQDAIDEIHRLRHPEAAA